MTLSGGALALMQFMSGAAHAAPVDRGLSEPGSEIIVTGTRRAERTVANSSVPVDVIGRQDLLSAPSADLTDKLAQTVPSFNVQRLPSYDGAVFVRPATLRGLSPDQTLVLLNGKRRHRSAYVDIQQQGEQAVDLSQIPQIAIGRIEVLRDGASAQYGSDAIAGVINILLDDTPGVQLIAQGSQYYKGDGENLQLSGRAGVSLGDRGVLSGSFEYVDADPTDRGSSVSKIGQPSLTSYKGFLNFKYQATDNVEAYAFGNYGYTRGQTEFSQRPTSSSVFARSAFQDAPYSIYPSYSLADRYPNGFIPLFGSKIRDSSLVAGLRGEASPGFTIDISGRYGRDRIDYDVRNSINASLGPLSPTDFKTGTWIQTEQSANADFNYLLDAGLATPINISFGGEWRREEFQLRAGDEAAYAVGPFSDLIPGANSYPSPTPDQTGRWDRESAAAYLDVDVDFTDRFNVDVAGRYEHYSDFGSTWNYKISSRYKLTDWLNVRGGYSTGFHAPSPGQQNLTNTTQGPDPLSPPTAQRILSNGLIPSINPIAVAAGGLPLRPEKARNISAGFVVHPSEALTLSVDYYRIKIRGRLGLTSTLTLTPAQKTSLIAAGVAQAASLDQFRFFINGYDTRTQGVDVVASYRLPLGSGRLGLTAAYNYNDTKITRGDPLVVTENLFQDVEQRRPHHTANASADYQIGKFGLFGRVRYYSGFTDALAYLPPALNQRIGAEAFVDVAVTYRMTPAISLTAGAENILNNYPDRYRGVLSAYGINYPSLRPYEADGGKYYGRLAVSF
ncbi:MAG: TonB-dependent receptor [Sphingomonadales bacterium]|nr:TonB-dependent receptor [Sphingomonadales bacterium]